MYHLLFYHDRSFNEGYKKHYKHLLELTDVDRKTNRSLKAAGSLKYLEVIRPLFILNKLRYPAVLFPPTLSRRSHSWTGKGLVCNEAPSEFVYWDDPNELANRPKLLITSQEVGNNLHQSEIVAIVIN